MNSENNNNSENNKEQKKLLEAILNKINNPKEIKLQDTIVTFYDNEHKKIKEIYEVNSCNEKCGFYKLFYKNGNYKKTMEYWNDKKHGLCHNYYPNGRWKKMRFYDDNILEREIVTYYNNKKGSIKRTIDYHGGQKNGYCFKYYKNGNRKEVYEYNYNVKVGYHSYYNKQNKLIKKIKIEKNV